MSRWSDRYSAQRIPPDFGKARPRRASADEQSARDENGIWQTIGAAAPGVGTALGAGIGTLAGGPMGGLVGSAIGGGLGTLGGAAASGFGQSRVQKYDDEELRRQEAEMDRQARMQALTMMLGRVR
jgi:hypothetical protein